MEDKKSFSLKNYAYEALVDKEDHPVLGVTENLHKKDGEEGADRKGFRRGRGAK